MTRIFLVFFIVTLILTGCAANKVASMSRGDRNDIFEVLASKVAVAPGHADLAITASLKTAATGTSDYFLIVNIDGQAAQFEGVPTKENGSFLESENPESGEGVRYLFRRDLHLSSGWHNLFIGLTKNGVFMEKKIQLTAGGANYLEIIPIYGKRRLGRFPGHNEVTTFRAGIVGLKAFLNGREP